MYKVKTDKAASVLGWQWGGRGLREEGEKVLPLSSFLLVPGLDGIVFCTHAETLASADLEGILEMK